LLLKEYKPGMKHSCHVLIIKLGALGDVVRTSYFARSLREK